MKTRDASFNATNNGHYDEFANDVTYAFNNIGYFRVNIFTDASGLTYAKDSNNNDIIGRLVTSMSYMYPYVVEGSGQVVFGQFTIKFNDEATFSNGDDNESAYWYSIEGETAIKPLT
jgi:hypothetical protein